MLDIKSFLSAITLLEEKGIAREITIQALTETFETIVKKKHVDGLPDEMVKVEIVPEEKRIDIFNIKNIVEEVEDDAIEISLEDAREIDPNYNIGDQAFIRLEVDNFSKHDAMKFKTILKQKMKEAEKQAILAIYSDKVNEIITGHVEKIEPRYTLINIDRTTVVLSDKEKIGDEEFEIGQPVKVYLLGVGANGESGITISRACPGFLKRLFEEEIHDVFSGTVIIKDIAREAGERAKVSVYTNDINVDPVGACIGPGGSKIQKICSQINHEKIDVIQYHEHKGLFIVECLKPATVLGVKIEEDGSAVAVVKDGDLKVAIGRKGVNARLAVKLAGCKIDIKEHALAIEEGINFFTVDEMKQQEADMILEIRKQELLEKIRREEEERKIQEEIKKQTQVDDVNDSDEIDEDVDSDVDTDVIDNNDTIDFTEVKTQVDDVKNDVDDTKDDEEVIEYTPVIMQPKVSLADLEKQIEDEKKKKSNQNNFSKKKNKNEEVVEVKKGTTQRMDIYTQEELDELDYDEYDEDYVDDDEDIDYDEYDSYYDED